MQTTYCDVCKKKIDDPVTNLTFYYFEKFGVCEPCKDSLEAQIKPTMRDKEPYAINWYSKLITDSLDKGCQKGKI
jgi:hypothetical protein